MNVRQPPPYDPPVPDDQDENADKTSILWSRIQSFCILAALILVVAELILAVQDRGLAHKALGIAKQANGVATNQVSLVCRTQRT